MKTFILCQSFIRKNILPIFITILMLTVSMFVLATFYGEYRYAAYTRDVMLRSDYDDGVYFMLNSQGDPNSTKSLSSKMQNEILEFTACAHILNYTSFVEENDHAFFNVNLFDKHMRKGFKLSVTEGRWLSENPEYTEAVIGGSYRGHTKIGDTITLKNGITAKVVGKMDDMVIYPSFSSSGNADFPANSLFRVNDTNIFLTEETIPAELYENISNLRREKNFYVVFREDASESERAELIAFLESNGMIASYEKIIQDSNAFIKDWIAGAFPLPVFLIIISTMSIICICAVIVKRSMPEYSKYYLMGCSKRKGIALIASPMALLFSTPCVLNLISVLWMPHFLRAGKRTGAINYLLGVDAAIPILIYLVLIMSILYIIPVLFYRKHSPLTFYRRNL